MRIHIWELAICMFILGLCVTWIFSEEKFFKEKIKIYKVTVYHTGKQKLKLILNIEQYQSFERWLFSSGEAFDIGTETEKISIFRKHISYVKMIRK